MFANTQAGGTSTAFPDTCLTPPDGSPIPYSNTASGATGVPAVYHIMFSCAPAHNLSTTVPTTNGDESGTYTGAASGTVMGPSRHTTGSFTVLVGGMPVTKMTSASMQNSTNAVGTAVAPAQVKVLMLSA